MQTASCNCGQLSLTVSCEPVRVSVCHCHACQKRTGSAFGVQARYPREEVAFTGVSHHYRRVGDEGGKISFSFCPECGGTLWFTLDVQPGVIVIPLGNFAGADFPKEAIPAPSVSVYQSRCHDWVRLDGISEVYD